MILLYIIKVDGAVIFATLVVPGDLSHALREELDRTGGLQPEEGFNVARPLGIQNFLHGAASFPLRRSWDTPSFIGTRQSYWNIRNPIESSL